MANPPNRRAVTYDWDCEAIMEIDPSLIITDRGQTIGTYRERDIAEWMEKGGERFSYDRIAVEDSDGGVPLSQLRPDEFVVAPGLIYRRTT